MIKIAMIKINKITVSVTKVVNHTLECPAALRAFETYPLWVSMFLKETL